MGSKCVFSLLTSSDLSNLRNRRSLVFAKDEIVFARTSPQHKLEIVKRAQALGHIVGVYALLVSVADFAPQLTPLPTSSVLVMVSMILPL